MKYTDEVKKEAIHMLREGFSYKEVSEKSGASISTINRWVEKYDDELKKKNRTNDFMISYKDLVEAYKKLKSYFYYDSNMLLDIRLEIAIFEKKIYGQYNFNEKDKERLELVRNKIRKKFQTYDEVTLVGLKDFLEIKMYELSLEISEKKIEKYFKNIKSKRVIKAVNEKSQKEEERKEIKIITNNSCVKEYDISQNFIIDAPIEIHLLSTLWTMKLGKYLDNNFFENSYGHRLDLYKKEVIENCELKIKKEFVGERKLFKRYHTQYQTWRNKALNEVKHIIEEDQEDCILINLDIKKFFYNISGLDKLLEEEEIIEILSEMSIPEKKEIELLTGYIEKINFKYKEELYSKFKSDEKFIYVEKKGVTPLPIGLFSSMILGNYSLKKIDKLILKGSSPSYYGRYVDDILLVYKLNKKIEKEMNLCLNDGTEILKYYLESNKILEYVKLETEKSYYQILLGEEESKLRIQGDKINVFMFKSEDSVALLDTFLESININASAFNFLPEEEEILDGFNKNAVSIQYNGSPLKISSIDGIKDDKLKLSIYLSKALTFSKYNNKEKNKKFGEEILKFFKEKYLLKYSMLWEKIFTYFVMKNDKESIGILYLRIIKEIERIEDQELKVSIKDYLIKSLCLPLASNEKLIKKIDFLINESNQLCLGIKIQSYVKALVESNLIRHAYIHDPLLNYIKFKPEEKINYFKNYIIKKSKNLDPLKLKYSPRYIHLNEFILYFFEREVFDLEFNNNNENKLNYIDESFKKFLNYSYVSTSDERLDVKKYYGPLEGKDGVYLNKIISEPKEKLSKFKIGLGNIEIPEKNIINNLEKNQVLTSEREEQLNKIMNEAKKEKVDIIILPELSVPIQWLGKITEFSRKNDIAIICGIEHLKTKSNTILNFLVTILPFSVSAGYKTNYIKFRLKNYYSPGEKDLIKGRDYKIPEDTFKCSNYDLFYWKGLYFTLFNCFELTSIKDRSQFQGIVDLLIASVYNRDIGYFEDILYSTGRDLHCYTIQSNTSNYGDSMILQPSKESYEREILRVKGGKNTTLLVGEISVEELRKFQITNHSLQRIGKVKFKPTPPEYTTDMAWNRIEENIEFGKIGDENKNV